MPPRDRVVSGNTDTSHRRDGVVAEVLHQPAQRDALVPCGVPGEGRRLLPHRHLHGDREVVAGALGDALADEAEHEGPALQRSAELVVAPVPERRQELVDQLGVARRELEAVVAGLARPRGGLAVLHGHGADVVGRHHVDRRAPVHGAEREGWLRRRQQRPLALGGVGLVPRLHREQPAEAHLDPDRRTRPVDGVDHRRQAEHPLPRAHDRHARRGAALVVEAGVALDDEADARPRRWPRTAWRRWRRRPRRRRRPRARARGTAGSGARWSPRCGSVRGPVARSQPSIRP